VVLHYILTAGNPKGNYITQRHRRCSASGAVTIVVTKATAPTKLPKTVELMALFLHLSASAAGTITLYADATTTASLATVHHILLAAFQQLAKQYIHIK
jgi:hypothetical protein